MKARELQPDIFTALTVTQFCQMFDITPGRYVALKQNGQGPREVCISDRIVIPLDFAAHWLVETQPLRVFAQRYLCG